MTMRPISASDKTELANEVLLLVGHVLRDDREEDDVVDAQDQLQDCERDQGYK